MRSPARPARISSFPFSPPARWLIVIGLAVVAVLFLRQVGTIAWPFVWAILAAYIIMPLVNFLNFRLRVPRFLVVLGIFLVIILGLIVASRYLIPWVRDQLSYFSQDVPKLAGSLESKVGRKPFGIDIDSVQRQLANRLNGTSGNASNSIHLLTSAFTILLRVLLFLFTTFYLLMDGPRIGRNLQRIVPLDYRAEVLRVASEINATWMNYIRGELILFGIMTTASFIGLEVLQVPGAVPLAVATGVLELLPIVGPVTAGALAVGVAYLNGTNPFGWSQITYGIVVALMYLTFREIEDYVVVPRVLGHAVKLHPLVILFSLAAGGVLAGLFGLLVAVPVAGGLKIAGAYIYDKLVPQAPQFVGVHGVGDSEPAAPG